MPLNSNQWVLVPIMIDIDLALQLFKKEWGHKYDWLGLITTKLTCLKSSKEKWFCSELCAYMCQIPDSGNFGVSRLYTWSISQ
jgi:hypothetical protein